MTAGPDTRTSVSRPSVSRPSVPPGWFRRFRSEAGTTPGRLRGLLAAMILATLAVCATGVEAVAELRNTTETAAERTSPTVIDAALVRVLLADADRVAVRSLLPPTAGGKRTTNGPGGLYQEDIKSVEQALERARTTGQVDLDAIRTVNDQMVVYLGDVAQAQAHAHAYAVASPAPDPANSVDLSVVYLSYAAEQLRSKDGILVAVENFRLANRSHLPNQGWGPWLLLVLHLTAGAVLLGLAVGAQLFLRRRFHRRASLELVGVAAIVVLMCGWTTAQSTATSRALDEGVRETDRVTCLSQARALAALADRDHRYGVHLPLEVSNAHPPQGACAAATPAYKEHPTDAQAGGFLSEQDGVETQRKLRTLLSAPPATASVGDSMYLDVDRSLRQLQESRTAPLARAWDDALPVRGLEWILIICAAAVVGLTLAVFAPRLREYRRRS